MELYLVYYICTINMNAKIEFNTITLNLSNNYFEFYFIEFS